MSIWHLIILLIVCALVFGTGKLSNIGPDLGAAIRGFKQNLNGDDDEIKRREVERLRADAQATRNNVEQKQPENVDVG